MRKLYTPEVLPLSSRLPMAPSTTPATTPAAEPTAAATPVAIGVACSVIDDAFRIALRAAERILVGAFLAALVARRATALMRRATDLAFDFIVPRRDPPRFAVLLRVPADL